jgi:hypothetical protein
MSADADADGDCDGNDQQGSDYSDAFLLFTGTR